MLQKRMKSENFTDSEHKCTKEKNSKTPPQHHLNNLHSIHSTKKENIYRWRGRERERGGGGGGRWGGWGKQPFSGLYYFKTHWSQVDISCREFRCNWISQRGMVRQDLSQCFGGVCNAIHSENKSMLWGEVAHAPCRIQHDPKPRPCLLTITWRCQSPPCEWFKTHGEK